MEAAATPLVTVITPSLNRASLIGRTLRSVRSQTHRATEHIVVDGGSSDGTTAILRQLEGSYDLRWISEPDGGMYEAVNKGLALASGEIVGYLNTDDLYFPWTVRAVVDAFGRHPDADLVFGDVLSVDDRTRAQRIHWQYPFDLDYIRRSGFLAQPAVFWRRGVVEAAGGFDQALRYVADCDLWMRLGEKRRFHKIDEVLAIERDHPGTLRAAQASSLEAELSVVRQRYVTLGGAGHRLRQARHRLRLAALRRRYWLRFALAAWGSRAAGQRAWGQFLGVPGLRVSAPMMLAHQIPFVGPSLEDRVLHGTPYLPEWLSA